MIRLKYIANFQKGRIPPELFSQPTPSRIPYLSMEYLRGQTTAPEYAEQEDSIIANDGDMILLWDGSNAGEFIKAKHGVVSSTGAVASVLNVESDFFFYLCKFLEPQIRAETIGMGIPHVNGEFLGNLPLDIPPKSTQIEIASYLDEQTARIDTLIAAKQRLLNLLTEKRRALITQAVTKGLDSSVTMKNSGIPWLGEIPVHWEVSRLAWLFSERDERNQPDLPLLVVSIHHGVTLREFSEERIEQQAEDASTYKVARTGDISFNKMRMWQGAVGRVPCDGLVSPDYVVAASIADIDTSYYGLLFKIPAFSAESAKQSHGIVWDRLRLYWEGFRDIAVPVPPNQEQNAIVDYIEKETGKIDLLRQATERTIKLLQERHAALISDAVTGKISIESMGSTTEASHEN